MEYSIFINNFISLVIAALAGIVSYVFKIYFFDGSNISFIRPPKLYKNYITEYINPKAGNWGSETVTINQFGKLIWGTISENNTTYSVKFLGTVNHDRIISYKFRPNDSRSNDYGIGLLQLEKYVEGATGFVIYLDDKNQTPVTAKVRLKKID